MTSNRLSLLSQRMSTLTLWLIVSMLAFNAICWAFPDVGRWVSAHGAAYALTGKLVPGLGIDLRALPLWQRSGGVLLSSVPLGALAVGLRHLRALFRCYGRREYFSVEAADHLGKLGKWVCLWVLFQFLCEPLLSVWLTFLAPVGHRVLSLSIGSTEIVALFVAASITVIAHILRKASELESEHRQFV